MLEVTKPHCATTQSTREAKTAGRYGVVSPLPPQPSPPKALTKRWHHCTSQLPTPKRSKNEATPKVAPADDNRTAALNAGKRATVTARTLRVCHRATLRKQMRATMEVAVSCHQCVFEMAGGLIPP